MTVIDATDVTKTYGDVIALDEFSLSIEEGDVFGLIGTNGAGKSTFLRLLVGHERPDSGEISVAGLSPERGTAVRQFVGYMPEQAGFHPALTGREELAVHARLRDVPESDRATRIDRVLATVGLEEAGDRRTGGYSNGMLRRLALAATLLGQPQALLLDEPTAGLDPLGVDAFNDIITRIREETNITVLITSHVMPEIETLCENVAMMHEGKVRLGGTVDEIRQVGGRVTVTVDFDETPRRADLETAVAGLANVGIRSLDGSTATVECPRGEAYAVLAAIQDRFPMEGFEVTEPGLSWAFKQAVARSERGVADGG